MRVLVTGANGQVGSLIPAALSQHEVLACSHSMLDISHREQVEAVVSEHGPEVIINCASMTNVDACETDPDQALAVNALGVRHLAVAANRVGAHIVHVSTDYVFDGNSERPYNEWDWAPIAPISVYGQSKLGGEIELMHAAKSWSIARTAWVFGRPGTDFVSWVVRAYRAGDLQGLVADQKSSPTYAPDLVAVLVRLATERVQGIFHAVNAEPASRFDQGIAALELMGLDVSGIKSIAAKDLSRPAQRPAFSALDTMAMRLLGWPPMRSWRDAMKEYVAAHGAEL